MERVHKEHSRYDLIVIGGGPAGCSTAIAAAQRGLRVALLERAPSAREAPGETLHPGVEPLLRQLGVWEEVVAAGFPRHTGIWVQWNNERRFEPYGSDAMGTWQGLQAWRADFDAILLERAGHVGVRVLRPCRALCPAMTTGRVDGVMTSAGLLSSAFVIDASGSRHWLSRQLRLKLETRSSRLIAYYGYADGECPERDEAPAITTDEKGWTWTAKVRPKFYGWVRLTLHDAITTAVRPPDEFQQLKPRGKVRGADVTWRLVTPVAGPGYFLIGDAAAVLDPASSHGVLKAIMSGVMAAHGIVQILDHGRREPEVAAAYNHWMRHWFEHDERRLSELYMKDLFHKHGQA